MVKNFLLAVFCGILSTFFASEFALMYKEHPDQFHLVWSQYISFGLATVSLSSAIVIIDPWVKKKLELVFEEKAHTQEIRKLLEQAQNARNLLLKRIQEKDKEIEEYRATLDKASEYPNQ